MGMDGWGMGDGMLELRLLTAVLRWVGTMIGLVWA